MVSLAMTNLFRRLAGLPIRLLGTFSRFIPSETVILTRAYFGRSLQQILYPRIQVRILFIRKGALTTGELLQVLIDILVTARTLVLLRDDLLQFLSTIGSGSSGRFLAEDVEDVLKRTERFIDLLTALVQVDVIV